MATLAIRNPERVTDAAEISGIIALLDDFAHATGEPAVIIERQNRTLGGSFDVATESEARSRLKKWVGSEIYLNFWDRKYFVDLQKKYS
ncbi:hypothetical protein HY493_04475 [Candidatus Woesearchaeota archaeon]|nr:hypothetical protein [Candidatus Woesearchaeota archaeon]